VGCEYSLSRANVPAGAPVAQKALGKASEA